MVLVVHIHCTVTVALQLVVGRPLGLRTALACASTRGLNKVRYGYGLFHLPPPVYTTTSTATVSATQHCTRSCALSDCALPSLHCSPLFSPSMVSFICDDCQSTLKKAKVSNHSWQCSSRSFSCIDCGHSFNPHTVASHTECISEAQKYQGKLYKPKRAPQTPAIPPPSTSTPPLPTPVSPLAPPPPADEEKRPSKKQRTEVEEVIAISPAEADVAAALVATLEESVSAGHSEAEWSWRWSFAGGRGLSSDLSLSSVLFVL